jgi:hypothetical protein
LFCLLKSVTFVSCEVTVRAVIVPVDGKGFFPPVKISEDVIFFITLYPILRKSNKKLFFFLLIRSIRSISLGSSIVALLLSADVLIAVLSL